MQTTEYDKQGQVTKTTGFDGNVTNFEYDFLGQLTKQSDGVGTYIEYGYYSNGQASTVKDGAGNTTSYEYDSDLKLTKTWKSGTDYELCCFIEPFRVFFPP